MAKERKSKHQKLLSDKRLSKDTSPAQPEHIYSLSSPRYLTSKKQKTAAISTSDYAYLTGDLKKFAVITASIIAVEIGIYWTSIGF